MASPFIVNAFIGSKVYARVLANDQVNGWRWGYGMFAIIVPVALAPLIATLFWGQRKAERVGIVPEKTHEELEIERLRGHESFGSKAVRLVKESDFAGLFILGVGLALLLIPLTLSKTLGWSNRMYSSTSLLLDH